MIGGFVSPRFTFAYTFEKSIGRDEADTLVRKLRTNPTFDIADTYVFPGRESFLHFIFGNLEVAGSLARASRTVNLRVLKRGEASYSARTRHALEGHCHRLQLTARGTRYVGRGTYRQDYVPFAIRGSTLIDVNWIPREEKDGVLLRVRMRLIPASDLIGVIGTALYPLVQLALADVLDRVVEVGREFSRTIHRRSGSVLFRLKLMNPEHAERWNQFMEENRMERTSVLR